MKTKLRIIALFLVAILVAAALSFAACGKEKSPNPDPTDSIATPTFDRATWTDEDIVGYAAMMRKKFMAGPRTEPIIDEYGFEAKMEDNTVTVYYPEGVYVNGTNNLPNIVVGRTYQGDFTLGNILSSYNEGNWVRATNDEWTLLSSDYSKSARIDINGNLYINENLIDNVSIEADKASLPSPITTENLSAAYREGRWSGRVVYDSFGNRAYLSARGDIVLNGKETMVWPALGPNDYVIDGFTVTTCGNTVILFKDGTISVYSHDGNLVGGLSSANPDQAIDQSTSAILPKGFYSYSEEERINIYLGTGGQAQDRLVEIYIATGDIADQKNTITRLHGEEYVSLIVYKVGTTLYGIDRDGREGPIMYGVGEVIKADATHVEIKTDTGTKVSVTYNGEDPFVG